jgi:hypothetical protein
MPTGKPAEIPQLHQMRGGGKPQNTDAAGAGNLLHPRDCLGYHSVQDCPPFDVAAQRIQGAWLVWNGVGSTSYWGVLGFVFLMPGTFFTPAMLPMFRGI